MKLLPSAVTTSERVRAALTASEAEIMQLMSGLRTDAGLEVNISTAGVLEVLAGHYFYSLTEEWPIQALARLVRDDSEATARQGLGTLAALAQSLRRGEGGHPGHVREDTSGHVRGDTSGHVSCVTASARETCLHRWVCLIDLSLFGTWHRSVCTRRPPPASPS